MTWVTLSLAADLKNIPELSVEKLRSEQEFQTVLCGAVYPLIGLLIRAGFDLAATGGEQVVFQGHVCWGRRYQVSDLRPKLEAMFAQSLNRPVTLQLEGNIVYPPC